MKCPDPTMAAVTSTRVPMNGTPVPSTSAGDLVKTVVKQEAGSGEQLLSPPTTCPSPASMGAPRINGEQPRNAPSSPKQPEDKKINNNTALYTAGGRLKFFKENRCILELTHRNLGERETWIPIQKKVYWPPPGPVKSEGSASGQSGVSDTASEAAGSVASPWQPTGPHRAKARPRRVKYHPDLHFAMKPPPCIVSLRKKVRNLRPKRRRPFSPIVVGAFLMRLEAQSVTTRPKRRPIEMDRIKKSSRLESTVTKLASARFSVGPKAKKPNVVVPIQAWKSKPAVPTTAPSRPGLVSQPVRIKSELCPVTETCTAGTLASPSQPKTSKVKAELRTVDARPQSSMSSAITLPITPTFARIKQSSSEQTPTLASSLLSPDFNRVRLEVTSLHRSGAISSTSPADVRDGSFFSPQKRLLREFENGSSPASKRIRLSTDSRGSSGSDGAASPKCQNPLLLHRQSPLAAQSPPRHNGHKMSFSMDSILGGGGADPMKPVVRPVPIPASPARIGEIKREFSSTSDGEISHGSRSPTPCFSPAIRSSPIRSSRSPPPARSAPPPVRSPSQPAPPIVPISPYTARGVDPRTSIDPRLAHLAGVAANPQLGLNPSNFYGMVNPYYLAAMAAGFGGGPASVASQIAAASGLWTPPAVTSATSRASTMTSASRPPVSSSANAFQQFRGENKMASMDTSPAESASDAPLNLSIKK